MNKVMIVSFIHTEYNYFKLLKIILPLQNMNPHLNALFLMTDESLLLPVFCKVTFEIAITLDEYLPYRKKEFKKILFNNIHKANFYGNL